MNYWTLTDKAKSLAAKSLIDPTVTVKVNSLGITDKSANYVLTNIQSFTPKDTFTVDAINDTYLIFNINNSKLNDTLTVNSLVLYATSNKESDAFIYAVIDYSENGVELPEKSTTTVKPVKILFEMGEIKVVFGIDTTEASSKFITTTKFTEDMNNKVDKPSDYASNPFVQKNSLPDMSRYVTTASAFTKIIADTLYAPANITYVKNVSESGSNIIITGQNDAQILSIPIPHNVTSGVLEDKVLKLTLEGETATVDINLSSLINTPEWATEDDINKLMTKS